MDCKENSFCERLDDYLTIKNPFLEFALIGIETMCETRAIAPMHPRLMRTKEGLVGRIALGTGAASGREETKVVTWL